MELVQADFSWICKLDLEFNSHSIVCKLGGLEFEHLQVLPRFDIGSLLPVNLEKVLKVLLQPLHVDRLCERYRSMPLRVNLTNSVVNLSAKIRLCHIPSSAVTHDAHCAVECVLVRI